MHIYRAYSSIVYISLADQLQISYMHACIYSSLIINFHNSVDEEQEEYTYKRSLKFKFLIFYNRFGNFSQNYFSKFHISEN